ncbi:uncharacterized protein AB675_8032 [Cyphellophora attinorum]|uniref:Uncharacterized protein n=1 Tax=Cyphellophora attinorum TaxID=1664694 RepID=A0A0N0NN86_9EURO|nr:uncharacterized protein AB675_8032 [Phialophora attinorum]KPI41079.1 hypothetical protein AB675_8032 [Phialophora attinorum]
MDLGGLVRAVTAAFQDGGKLVTKIRDDRASTDRALPEDPTRDLLDSLQLGPLLVKGQYDRDFKRFGEQLACGDNLAREQMKDVLINLQMALIISLRGVSMGGDENLDFDSLQQTSDDCRTNAADAMMPESELELPNTKYASIGYSSSRSTRSTRSRESRTPVESMHQQYQGQDDGATVRPIVKERKRANSSASNSKRGYQPRRPTTPSSQASRGQAITTQHAPTERRLRGVSSQEVLTPPDEETLRVIRNGYVDSRPTGRASNATRADSGYGTASYVGGSRKGTSTAYSMASSRSAGSYKTAHDPMPRMPIRAAKFGGISSQPASYASRDSVDEYAMSTLDDPTTSEEDDILSLRRPSSHALGPEEHDMLSPRLNEFPNRPASSARSYVVSLPDADLHEPPSPISVVSEGDEEAAELEHESLLVSPELLAANTYHPDDLEPPAHYALDDATPTLGPGEFGQATIYETSRIRPVENMPRDVPAPRMRVPRQDSLSRVRNSRLITGDDLRAGRSTPQPRSQEEMSATVRAAEARVKHYRARPQGLQHSESVRENQPQVMYGIPEQEPRVQHIANLQQNAPVPRHLADMPLPAPPGFDQRPDSRNRYSPKHRAPQGYKVFPAQAQQQSTHRGAPAPPPDIALPAPPPARGPKWMAEAAATGLRPSTSPQPPANAASAAKLPVPRVSEPELRPTISNAPTVEDKEISALPEDGPGPSERGDSIESPPPTAISKTSSNSSNPRMVKIVPMHMAMFGGVYTAPTPKVPKADKPVATSSASTKSTTATSAPAPIPVPPMPLTMPLTLPTEKQLQGFCKGAHRLFLGVDSKTMRISSRPIGISGNVHFWVCHKCHFQGPVSTISKTEVGKKGKTKVKEERIYDPKPRSSTIRGLDGEVGGVRYKWVFLAKCHVPLKAMTEELALGAGAAGKGEWGGFGCLFCCAEGVRRGWTDRDARGKLVVADGMSIMSGSTGSGDTTKSGSGVSKDTPVFKDLEAFMGHLEMHRKEDCWPGQEMMGRMRCVVGRRAMDGEEWEINFLPLKMDKADEH